MADLSYLWQPPSLIEGIGPKRVKQLKQAEITNIAELLATDAEFLAAALEGVSAETVSKWQGAGLLLQFDAITPDLAEALVDNNILTINRLADMGLQTFERIVKKAHENKTMADDETYSIYNLAAIQREAGKQRNTGMVFGTISAVDDEPIADAKLLIGTRSGETDAHGRFVIAGILMGLQPVLISFGNVRLSDEMFVYGNRMNDPLVLTVDVKQSEAGTPTSDYESGLIGLDGTSEQIIETVELSDLPDPTFLRITGTLKDGTIRLIHLYREARGLEVVSARVEVTEADLPDGAAVGDVLEWSDRKLKMSKKTHMDIALTKLARTLGPQKLTLTEVIDPLYPV